MKRTILFAAITVFTVSLFAETKNILILHTNDMRGIFEERPATWINPDFPPPLGGAASLYTAVETERKLAKDSSYSFLLVDAGSFLGGNIIGEGSDPELAVDVLNLVGYDVVNLGVYDFLLGKKGLDVIAERAKFSIISSNLTLSEDTTKHPDFVRPYVILNVDGVKIGIFGLISEYTPLMLPDESVEGYFFLREFPQAEKMVRELREKDVDIVIALTNIGMRHDTLLAGAVPGIDFIIGGYDGRGIREAYEHPVTHTVVVRTYGGLSDLGRLLIHYDTETHVITGYEWNTVSLLEESAPPDPEVRTMIEHRLKKDVDNSGSDT